MNIKRQKSLDSSSCGQLNAQASGRVQMNGRRIIEDINEAACDCRTCDAHTIDLEVQNAGRAKNTALTTWTSERVRAFAISFQSTGYNGLGHRESWEIAPAEILREYKTAF
ncbi:hypothetical protein AAL_05650 [Moelleriella libera RCEF 2490]|uniref:Uncharacterized protein n=1 Tax=Moelleriella libera RCEF 2490 TaxID=1081109 RepID=A0A167ZZ00_9HYPO|nr:hypothetical protein AAL_05650 [Moelleriella libera RCEF 2490]